MKSSRVRTAAARRRLRRAGRVTLALLATAVMAGSGLLANVSPAAAVAGLQFIPDFTISDSSPSKLLNIPCPVNTTGIGGEVEIFGSTRVRIQGIYPKDSAVGFKVVEPAGGVPENWSFTARAVCAPFSSLPGVQYVKGTTTEVALGRSTTTTFAGAMCPTNKWAIGMGAEAYGDTSAGQQVDSNVTLFALRATGGSGGAPSYAYGFAAAYGYDGTFTVNSVAVCVDRIRVPTAYWGWADSPTDSNADKLIRYSCGNAGTVVHSGGFIIDWDGSDDTAQHIGVNRLLLRDSRGGSNPTVEVIAREDSVGTTDTWKVFSQAICA